VLTRAKLDPEIHASAFIRYSPDSKYLFVQDPAGVMLFSRNPLQFIKYIDAPHAYPAAFSANSQTLSLVSFDLFFSRWRVADGQQIESPNLTIPDGCLAAKLSPGANLLACATPDLQLAIYRLEDAKRVFSAQIHSVPAGINRVPIPFDSTTDFSAPFGYFVSNSFKQIANRGLVSVPVWFSPDGESVIAGDNSSAIRINLNNFSKENFSSPLHKRMYAIAGIAENDRALLLDRLKSEPPSVVAVSTGQVILNFPYPIDAAHLCTNTRFAIFRQSDSNLQIADLSSATTIAAPDSRAADVAGDEIAVLKRDGTVLFFKYGEAKATTGARLPLGSLSQLRAANVDAGLATLALSVDGMGGTFDVATGKSLLEQKTFVGVQVADLKRPLFLEQRKFKTPHQILRADLDAHSVQNSWIAQPEAELLSGESDFLEYSLANEFGRGMVILLDRSAIPFVLRGLDPATGTQSWRMKFSSDIPVPFCDPQGNRFVLGWQAKSDHASSALKGAPEVLGIYKHSKKMEQDSVFEVFDGATGKSLGGVFVQFGDGPISFTAAFSVGDFLFLIKDSARVTVMSLHDGKTVAQLKGFQPTANSQSNLFVLDQGYGRLGIFDLTSGKKIEEQQFADGIAYKHFSADGKKLLVLTQHQIVYVLDMSQVREHPLAPMHTEPDPSDTVPDQPQ